MVDNNISTIETKNDLTIEPIKQQNEKPTNDIGQTPNLLVSNVMIPNVQQQQSQSINLVTPGTQTSPRPDNAPVEVDASVLPHQSDHSINSINQSTSNSPALLDRSSHQHASIKPLLDVESKGDVVVNIAPGIETKLDSPQKSIVTKVKLSDELNIFDWIRTKDIINQLTEKAKSSVDSVITTLDPGMKEYLYSGGNINIVVICDSRRILSPIRDSFQDVFGRATVKGARFDSGIVYPIRLAAGFEGSVRVAKEKIRLLRQDTNSIAQNQVILVVQPAVVDLPDDNKHTVTENSDRVIQSKWFITYCMIIDDPVLRVTFRVHSQLIPVDQDVVEAAKEADANQTFNDKHLGFTFSIDRLMNAKLRMNSEEIGGDDRGCAWLPKWAGIYETDVMKQLSLILANLYRRRWNECASIETA